MACTPDEVDKVAEVVKMTTMCGQVVVDLVKSTPVDILHSLQTIDRLTSA